MDKKAKKFKKSEIEIPSIPPSNFTKKLRRDNENLMNHLERLEILPFSIRLPFKDK